MALVFATDESHGYSREIPEDDTGENSVRQARPDRGARVRIRVCLCASDPSRVEAVQATTAACAMCRE